jgi:molecular chaperone DnaK (HSP70)
MTPTRGRRRGGGVFKFARASTLRGMRLLLHSWFCLATASASGALGIDVGSANSVVAVTRRGGVDVVANEATKRQTPSVVAFDERRRFMGESASALRSSRPGGCVAGSKALIGCDYSDTGTDQVDYLGRKRTFSPVQIFAMLLHHLHVTAEREHGSALPECALAVPAHWGAAQRQAVLDAAEVAGTRCVRLISDVRLPPTAPSHRALPLRALIARVRRPSPCIV